ncbi:MAG: DUF4189 domain-containing protein [Betaproteobacteria bacterium]|nr:DUF4189 domain-containing protein [Betaproteobacteria bacterium]
MGHRRNHVVVALAALILSGSALDCHAQKRDSRVGTFAAIAYHPKGKEFGWATDRRTSREAGAEALKQCAHPRCEVAITVRNACAALARGPKQSRAQKGVSQQDAEARALTRCGDKCDIVAWTCTR